MLADLKSALRMLTKAPSLSAVIILSLAIGIGANTVVFSWVQAVFFDPLPGVAHGARLMTVVAHDHNGTLLGTSWLDYLDLRGQQTSFREIAASRIRAFNLGSADNQDDRIWGELTSDNYFALLGLHPALGRFFKPDEATQPGTSPVAVISYDCWQTRFNGSPTVLGQALRLNDVVFTIVGVAPEKFKGSVVGLGLDLWLPFTMVKQLIPSSKELTARDNRSLVLLADLKPGFSRQQAKAELDAIFQRQAQMYPETNTGISADVLPLWLSPVGAQQKMREALGTLQSIVFLVLLVVCANTANLLLAHATVRQKEIGIRLALGASRWRILRQLLTESIVLALLGSAGGVLLSLWGIQALYRVPLPGNLPIKITTHLDAIGCSFSILLAVACGIFFGLAPALQLSRADVATTLKIGGRGSGASAHHRLRNLLVGAEVALALVVLILAGLFLKSFGNAQTVNPGFNTQGVLIANFDLAGRGYDKKSGRIFIRNLLTHLRGTPGVETATVSTFVPLSLANRLPSDTVAVDGKPVDHDQSGRTFFCAVTPGYFQTLEIPLVAGADFVDLDSTAKSQEVIVNQELGRRCWPGMSPLGHKLTMDWEVYEVVGVARDSKYDTLSEGPTPMAYFSLRDRVVLYNLTLQVRTRGDPLALAPEVRRVVHVVDTNMPIRDVNTLAQHIDDNLVLLRVPARMLSVLGPLTLLLAAIGIYSVLSYSVAQRTSEIGVRLALGATSGAVVRMIVRQGVNAVAVGLATGLLTALAVSFYLSHILVKVPPGDPLVFITIPALLVAVSWFACWLPARRAARVDPLTALRSE